MSKRPSKRGGTRAQPATFQGAVADAPSPVNQAYRPGKQALERRHRKLVTCSDTQRLTGSIALDTTLAQHPDYANQSRWDYGIGYKPRMGTERAVWVEVHTATTSEVSAVIRKLQWLRAWLRSEAEQLNRLTGDVGEERFVWIASNGDHILRNSSQFRRLQQTVIRRPRNSLTLT